MKDKYMATTFVTDSRERYCMVMERSSRLLFSWPLFFNNSNPQQRGMLFQFSHAQVKG